MSKLNHIAFIPDGNRRWARQHGLPTLEGHKKGYDRFRDVLDWCSAREIKEVSAWGFSTENWKRTQEEVGYLVRLMEKMLIDELGELVKRNVRVQIIGRRSDLSEKLQKGITDLEEKTRKGTAGTLNILFNYSGRSDILQAVETCLRDGLDPDMLDEEVFGSHLWTGRMSKPDLIVRTSGEQRLSGFLPWIGTYSEYYFPQCYWPDFDERALDAAITSFNGRERRFGGDSSKR